jgi:hypothetical protein
LGVAPITLKTVKDKWRNLAPSVKSTFTEYRKEVNTTSGGPATKKPTLFMESIVNILQDTIHFSGIECGLETAGFTTEQNPIIHSSNALWRCQFIPFKTLSQNQQQANNK